MNRLARLTPATLWRSAALWPATTIYVFGVGNILLIADGEATVTQGIILFAVLTALVIIRAVLLELHTVHELVNSRHIDLTDRVDQLRDALVAGGVAVPVARGSNVGRRKGDR